MSVQYRSGGDIFGTLNITGGLNVNGNPIIGQSQSMIIVDNVLDFPTASAGVIYLNQDRIYYLTTTVDLSGSRLVSDSHISILGGSADNSILKSTGLLSTVPLLSTTNSISLQNITVSAPNALYLNAVGTGKIIEWRGVNFLSCFNIGTIKNYANFISDVGIFSQSSNLVFDGSVDTIAFNNTLFDVPSFGSLITIPASSTVTRRFRIIYSAFVVASGGTGITVMTAASVPVEGYILDTVNFAGTGTYLSGVPSFDNKAVFSNCKGITNSSSIGQYYMTSNATATVIPTTTTFYKISGATTVGNITQKFTPTDNRLTYTGSSIRIFKISAIASMASGNNNQVYLAVAKNGVVDASSALPTTTSGTGRADNTKTHTFLSLSSGDYVEMFVKNVTASTNITVTDLNVIMEPSI